jgi:hypothetical protein
VPRQESGREGEKEEARKALPLLVRSVLEKVNEEATNDYAEYVLNALEGSYEERLAATTRLTFDEGLRVECAAFVEWLDELMYLRYEDIAGVQCDARWLWCKQQLSSNVNWAALNGPRFFIDMYNRNNGDRLDGVYLLYREHGEKPSTIPPPSFLVFHQLCCLCNNSTDNLVVETLKSWVQLPEEERKRVAEKAVREAENALREEAKAKRRRTH